MQRLGTPVGEQWKCKEVLVYQVEIQLFGYGKSSDMYRGVHMEAE